MVVGVLFAHGNGSLGQIRYRGATANLNDVHGNDIEFMLYNDSSVNTPFKEGLTGSSLGTVISHSNGTGIYVGQFAFPSGTKYPFFRCRDNNKWYQWEQLALKSDLATKTITNFNSALSNGIYYAANNTSSSPVSDGHFMVYVAVLDSANASQIAVGLNLSGNTYIRTLRNGTWGAWKKVGFES